LGFLRRRDREFQALIPRAATPGAYYTLKEKADRPLLSPEVRTVG